MVQGPQVVLEIVEEPILVLDLAQVLVANLAIRQLAKAAVLAVNPVILKKDPAKALALGLVMALTMDLPVDLRMNQMETRWAFTSTAVSPFQVKALEA